ncbi:MAG: hypothetical protein IKO35_04365 [Elusimicrobiaceae bacterium]|nr:hypothetical protein [Elusimicrobiaceae bacterium]
MQNKWIYSQKLNYLCQRWAGVFVWDATKRRRLRKWLQSIYEQEQKKKLALLIHKQYTDSYCFFSRDGLGDVYFLASLMQSFKKEHPGKVIFFTAKKSLVPLLTSFSAIDEVVCKPELNFLQSGQVLQRPVQKGTLNRLFFPYRGTKKTYTFADNYAHLLGVPADASRQVPVLSSDNFKRAAAEFERLQLDPARTVILSPEATMFDYRVLDSYFWLQLAQKIKQRGFQVVFNSRDKAYQQEKNSFLPVMDLAAFTSKVQHIIAFRSGLLDLLAGLGLTNFSAIYPANLEVIWAEESEFARLNQNHSKLHDSEFENIFHIYSLNSNFGRKDIQEYVYQNEPDVLEAALLSRLEGRE